MVSDVGKKKNTLWIIDKAGEMLLESWEGWGRVKNPVPCSCSHKAHHRASVSPRGRWELGNSGLDSSASPQPQQSQDQAFTPRG